MKRLFFLGLLLCIINVSCSKSVHRRKVDNAMNTDNADDYGVEERGIARHYEVWYELKHWMSENDSILTGFAEAISEAFCFA